MPAQKTVQADLLLRLILWMLQVPQNEQTIPISLPALKTLVKNEQLYANRGFKQTYSIFTNSYHNPVLVRLGCLVHFLLLKLKRAHRNTKRYRHNPGQQSAVISLYMIEYFRAWCASELHLQFLKYQIQVNRIRHLTEAVSDMCTVYYCQAMLIQELETPPT